MISVFDVEKLKKLLKDFYAITGIRITVFDDRCDVEFKSGIIVEVYI